MIKIRKKVFANKNSNFKHHRTTIDGPVENSRE